MNSYNTVVGKWLTIGQGDSSLPGVDWIIFQRPAFQTSRFHTGHFHLRRNLSDHPVDRSAKHADPRITFPAQGFLLNSDGSVRANENQNLGFRFLLLHNPSQTHIGTISDRHYVIRNGVDSSRTFKFQIVDEKMTPSGTFHIQLNSGYDWKFKGRRLITAGFREGRRHADLNCKVTDCVMSNQQCGWFRRISRNQSCLSVDFGFLNMQVPGSQFQYLPTFCVLSHLQFHANRRLMLAWRHEEIGLFGNDRDRNLTGRCIRASFLQQSFKLIAFHHDAAAVSFKHGLQLLGRDELLVGLANFSHWRCGSFLCEGNMTQRQHQQASGAGDQCACL